LVFQGERATPGATVRRRALLQSLSGADYSAPERVTGRDGKSYSSSRPSIVAAKNAREAARAQEALKTATVRFLGPLTPDTPLLRCANTLRAQPLRRCCQRGVAVFSR